jgi:hypothetical protein
VVVEGGGDVPGGSLGLRQGELAFGDCPMASGRYYRLPFRGERREGSGEAAYRVGDLWIVLDVGVAVPVARELREVALNEDCLDRSLDNLPGRVRGGWLGDLRGTISHRVARSRLGDLRLHPRPVFYNAAARYPVHVEGDQRAVSKTLVAAVHSYQAVLGQGAEPLVLKRGRQPGCPLAQAFGAAGGQGTVLKIARPELAIDCPRVAVEQQLVDRLSHQLLVIHGSSLLSRPAVVGIRRPRVRPRTARRSEHGRR